MARSAKSFGGSFGKAPAGNALQKNTGEKLPANVDPQSSVASPSGEAVPPINVETSHNLVESLQTRSVSGGVSASAASTGSTGGSTGSAGLTNSRVFERASGEWVAAADSAAQSVGDINFAVSCWVKLATLSVQQTIFGQYDNSTGSSRSWRLFLHQTNEFRLQVSTTGGTSGVTNVAKTPSTGITTNDWYHLLGWHDATADKVHLRVNAEAAAEAAHATGVFDSNAEVRIGSDYATNHFDGKACGAGLWKNGLLTTGLQAELYNAGKGMKYADMTTGLKANLVSWYELNEASGNAIDSHSTHNMTQNGTVGAASTGPAS